MKDEKLAKEMFDAVLNAETKFDHSEIENLSISVFSIDGFEFPVISLVYQLTEEAIIFSKLFIDEITDKDIEVFMNQFNKFEKEMNECLATQA